MSWFRREREKQDPVDSVAQPEPGTGLAAEAGLFEDSAAVGRARPVNEAARSTAHAVADRSAGPWDVSEVQGSEGYVDLGALWLPAEDGMELRLEVEEESGRVISATAQIAGSAVQLQAFAAPRTLGIWDEIREEIASSITSQGGQADQVPGPFGPELLARVPNRGADGEVAYQPARFAGVDGPRWFLRAVFHGPAAFDQDEAQVLEALVRGAVVVRGEDAMAPRELLALNVPGAGAPAPEPDDDEDSARRPLSPFERGPEITEVR